jgi:hypothetical protein
LSVPQVSLTGRRLVGAISRTPTRRCRFASRVGKRTNRNRDRRLLNHIDRAGSRYRRARHLPRMAL